MDRLPVSLPTRILAALTARFRTSVIHRTLRTPWRATSTVAGTLLTVAVSVPVPVPVPVAVPAAVPVAVHRRRIGVRPARNAVPRSGTYGSAPGDPVRRRSRAPGSAPG